MVRNTGQCCTVLLFAKIVSSLDIRYLVGYVNTGSVLFLDEIHELRERERERDIKPDLEIDAFMKVCASCWRQ